MIWDAIAPIMTALLCDFCSYGVDCAFFPRMYVVQVYVVTHEVGDPIQITNPF